LTVKIRIALAATLVATLVLVLASVLLVVRQRSGLMDQLDEVLERDADRVLGAIEAGGDPSTEGEDDDVLILVEISGTVTPVAGDAELLRELQSQRLSGEGDPRDVELDGERFRALADSSEVDGGGTGRVVVAAPLEDVDESVGELTSSLVIVIPAAAALLFVVVWFAVGRTLKPVDRIRREVDAIGLDDLDRRVPEPSGRDEIARLATTMNRMLARLQQASRAQRQFVGDASHELKTPLTRIRTELEVDERHPDTADPAATRASVLEEVVGLQRLIDDLLVLARIDADASSTTAARVDLTAIVRSEVDAAADRRVRTELGDDAAMTVVGDAGQLRRAVRNLLDNATEHARSSIVVALERADGRVRLSVSDDGEGIPPERRADVFERFTRLDEARSSGGTGLGLAIVRDVVVRCGGTVGIDTSALGGTVVIVELPAAEGDAP
jgi:signal transduction histidine kinase